MESVVINDMVLFQAISDPNRREILALLAREKYTITEIADHFEISRPAISKHVKVLSYAGFLSIEDKGRERYCSLNPAGFLALQEWLNHYEQFWNDKLNQLEKLLKTRNHGKRH